jgi:iron complex outermembrane receptor protein
MMGGLLLVNTATAEETEEKTFMLDEIVVTATKYEKSIMDAPGSVDVVVKKEIAKRSAKDVDEAIRMVPGVFDRRTKGFADVMPSINIRGLYGTDRNLILIDGQPVSEHVWRRFPLELVERIEVAKGPFSSLYGSGAMGGVVNIITSNPKDKIDIKIQTDFETNNSRLYEMQLAGKTNGWIYSASVRDRSTDGYVSNFTMKSSTTLETEPETGTLVTGASVTRDRYNNKKILIGDTGDNYYEDLSYSFKVKRELNDYSSLQIDYTRTDYEYGYQGDGSYLRDEDGNVVNSGTVYFYNSEEEAWERVSRISSTNFESTYGGTVVDLVNFAAETEISGINLKGSLSYDESDRWSAQPSLTSAYIKPSNEKKTRAELVASRELPFGQILTVGSELKNEEREYRKFSLSDWTDKNSATDMTEYQKGEIETLSFYMQDEIELFEPLTVYIGSRYDKWQAADGYNYIIKSGTETEYIFDDRDDDNISSRLSVVYKPGFDSRVKASIGQAFRGPTASELYSGSESVSQYTGDRTLSMPNLNLKPEKIVSTEFSYEKSFSDRVFVKAVYFYNKMSDYIYSKTFNSSEREEYNMTNFGDPDYYSEITQDQNIGKSKSQGLEFEIRARLTDYLETFASITEMDTEVVENPSSPESEGKKIPQIPERTASVGIDYFFSGISAGITGRYVGKRYKADDNSDIVDGVFGSYDPFFIVDTKISYTREIAGYTPTISFYIDNLFDKEYYRYYLAPGRTLGVRLSVGKKF